MVLMRECLVPGQGVGEEIPARYFILVKVAGKGYFTKCDKELIIQELLFKVNVCHIEQFRFVSCPIKAKFGADQRRNAMRGISILGASPGLENQIAIFPESLFNSQVPPEDIASLMSSWPIDDMLMMVIQ